MDIENLKNQMKKALSHLEQEFAQLQVWRASTSLVENIDIFIQSWWMSQKLSQIASINIIDAQTLKIEPWDKSNLSSIEKWIFDSGTWLTPMNQWDYLMIKIPPLTTERRQELTKLVSKLWEDTKVAIRNIRQDAMRDLKKQLEDKEISENEKGSQESKIEEITKEYNTKIDTVSKNKSEDIMKI